MYQFFVDGWLILMIKKVCFIHLKNWYSSFYQLIFEVAYNQLRIGNYELWIKVVLKIKSLFKKQWKNYRSAVAVAQSKCMFFYKKNNTLAGFFWFCGCQNVIMNGEFWIMKRVVLEMQHSQKQCPSAGSG